MFESSADRSRKFDLLGQINGRTLPADVRACDFLVEDAGALDFGIEDSVESSSVKSMTGVLGVGRFCSERVRVGVDTALTSCGNLDGATGTLEAEAGVFEAAVGALGGTSGSLGCIVGGFGATSGNLG